MMPPGASAVNDTGLAALTTPPGIIVGCCCRGSIAPATSAVPLICWCGLAAVTVSLTACAELCIPAYQVACHVPLFSEVSPSGGSPLVKVTVTFPDVCGLPQSS